jgi:signal peptidase I
MVKEGKVYVNGKVLHEEYLPTEVVTREKSTLRDGVPYIVPEGKYIVFGDNRDFSSDSREWGSITRKSIVGKAFLTYWPLDRLRIIQHERYED